jgi:metal-responsive CopG/Arc/MetJ family transcriptional regulator
MPQITLRVEQELYDRIEEKKGDKDRSTFLRDVIIAYFESQKNAVVSPENAVDSRKSANAPHENANVSQLHYANAYLKKKLEDLTALHDNEVALHSQEKQDMSNKLDRAMQLVSQEQSINMTMQKQLMPAPQEIIKKTWWQFWR